MCSAAQLWVWLADAQESRFQAAKRSEMCSAVMNGLIFANTQESCFETWKCSYMRCSALLCCRFDVSQESCFQASKRSNMGSSVLQGGPSADFPNYYFKLKTFRYGLCRSARETICWLSGMAFSVSKRTENCSMILQDGRFANFHEYCFSVWKVEICAVQSSNEFYLLMTRIAFSRSETIRNVQCSHEWTYIC